MYDLTALKNDANEVIRDVSESIKSFDAVCISAVECIDDQGSHWYEVFIRQMYKFFGDDMVHETVSAILSDKGWGRVVVKTT